MVRFFIIIGGGRVLFAAVVVTMSSLSSSGRDGVHSNGEGTTATQERVEATGPVSPFVSCLFGQR
jgi:hypothetical protein